MSSSVVAFALATADVAVIAGGAALVAFLAWFFFGEKQARQACATVCKRSRSS